MWKSFKNEEDQNQEQRHMHQLQHGIAMDNIFGELNEHHLVELVRKS